MLSLLLLPAWAMLAIASPGDPDTSFGVDGVVTTDVTGAWERISAATYDAGGKIVVTGWISGTDMFVARYNTDGSLDTSFSGDGVRVDDISGSYDYPSAVAVDSNGSIVVAGDTSSSLILVRYLADGSLDSSFSGDGIILGGVGSPASVTSMAIDSQDRIVIGGTGGFGSGWQWFAARFLPNGTLDSSFDGDGIVLYAGSDQYSAAVTVDADDNVVLAGSQGGSSHLHVLRWLENGTVDTTFSGDGIVSIGFGVNARSTTIAPDGAILVAGSTFGEPFVARVLDDGTFDSNFSTDGFATLPGGPYADAFMSVAGDAEGRVVASGYIANAEDSMMSIPEDFDLVVARFGADGVLDSSFAGDGVYTHTESSYDDSGEAVLIDADDRIVVGGYATAANWDALLLRLEGVEPPITTTTTSSSSTSSTTSSSSTSTTVPSTTTTTTVPEVPGEPEDPEVPVFEDDDGSVFGADISKLAQRGVTRGCNPPENTRFCPDEPVSRGQMAAFLIRILGEPDGMSDEDVFSDDNGSVFESDIEALAALGVTRGCDSPAHTRFCPEGQVSRGQMAAFLARALDLPATGDDFYTDDNGSVFESDINRVAAAGVARGCNPPANDRFCPDQLVTRGQMAAFLVRGFFTD